MLIPPILVIERTLKDAGIPIDGVSVGSAADRSTWRAFYQAAATAAQRTQGDGLLLTLDPQDPTVVAAIKVVEPVRIGLLGLRLQGERRTLGPHVRRLIPERGFKGCGPRVNE